MTCVNKQYSAIQLRRGLDSEFVSSNIILASGEPAFAVDTNILKIGDGTTDWNNLPTPSASGVTFYSGSGVNFFFENLEATSGNFSDLSINGSGVATLDYVDSLLSINDALLFKGTLGVGGTISALPSIYETGWVYKVTTAGTYAGNICEVGDLIIAIVDRPTGGGVDSDWVVAQTNIDLQSLPIISNPCNTEYVLVQDSARDTKVVSINNLAKAISVIDGGGVTYSGC
jgi:hypothetical protein